MTKYNLGQYNAAIIDFDNAIRLKSECSPTYGMRGLAKYMLGQYDAAIVDFNTTVQLKPDGESGYFCRGLAKVQIGQYDAAIIDFDNAIRLKPDYAVAYYNLGNARAKLGHTWQAERSWRTALKLATQAGNVELKNKIEVSCADLLMQVKTSNSTTDLQNAFYPDLETLPEDRQTSLEALQAFEKQSKVRLMQEPLLQNNEEVNQQAKQLLQQIPEDELEYPIDPKQLYVLQLVIHGFENTSDRLDRIRSGNDELRKYWDKVELLVYRLMEVSSKRAMNWLEENELVGPFDHKAQNDPDLAIYRVMESLMGYLMENGVSSRIIGDFGGLIESLSVDEVYTPIKEEHVAGTPNNTKTTIPELQAKEKVVHYSEDQIKDIVADYFKSLPTASSGYSVKREYLIQMGSSPRRADIVFLRNGKLVAITECKRTGRIESGHEQLKAYLCATDTFLGIFANNGDPNKWTFWENHRHNNFLEIDRETFENYVYNHDKTIKDRENKIKEEVQRGIDAEIRERVRKNTDTNAIEQNETDRIKRDVIEDIDRTAVVSSVRSQIAEQAENGLLNKRDEENYQRGLKQGIGCTIFSIIGVAILIALLIASAG